MTEKYMERTCGDITELIEYMKEKNLIGLSCTVTEATDIAIKVLIYDKLTQIESGLAENNKSRR